MGAAALNAVPTVESKGLFFLGKQETNFKSIQSFENIVCQIVHYPLLNQFVALAAINYGTLVTSLSTSHSLIIPHVPCHIQVH